DMNGWDVHRAIASDARNRATPTIVVTVVSERGAGVGMMVDDMLSKPVEPGTLLASLRRVGVPPDGRPPVLIVDDDPGLGAAIRITLEAEGYRPICKADGESGLAAAAAEPPAAGVLAPLMPGVDGGEVRRRRRA